MMERVCVNCGRVFVTEKSHRRMCNDCKLRKVDYHDKKPYIVISSPLDEDGLPEFPLKARFSYDDVNYTLRMCNFPNGLILRKRGIDYKVVGQSLVVVHDQASVEV